VLKCAGARSGMGEDISGTLQIPARCGRDAACATAVPWIKGHGF